MNYFCCFLTVPPYRADIAPPYWADIVPPYWADKYLLPGFRDVGHPLLAGELLDTLGIQHLLAATGFPPLLKQGFLIYSKFIRKGLVTTKKTGIPLLDIYKSHDIFISGIPISNLHNIKHKMFSDVPNKKIPKKLNFKHGLQTLQNKDFNYD